MPNPRLYTTEPLAAGTTVTLDEPRSHYLLNVMRLAEGANVQLFNGQDGEWQATIESARKKSASLNVQTLLRPQHASPDLWLLCAPLRGGKTEWVVEKATELGVSRICPVLTQFTVAQTINQTRLQAIAIEAAEQCERLDVPAITPLTALTALPGNWPKDRHLIYGDESGHSQNAKELLSALRAQKLALLIGPEGGFSPAELDLLRSLPYASGMCMGPRILRADTAAVSALTLVQANSGDWDAKPDFRR